MSAARSSEAPWICIQGLTKRYIQQAPLSKTTREVRALEDVNLSIQRGETLALVGESGSGKSTLGRCLALLEKATAGEILLGGKNLLVAGKRDLILHRRKIQLIFQGPIASLNPRLTALEIITEPLVIQKRGTNAQRSQKALQLMEQVGLSAVSAGKRPFEFSGGQCQRLALARALALDPDLLILDEALSNLDATNQSVILDLLAELRTTRSLTYLHISHDLNLVRKFADRVAIMCAGRIVEQGEARDLFARPQNAYTRSLLAAMPSIESIYADRFAQESR